MHSCFAVAYLILQQQKRKVAVACWMIATAKDGGKGRKGTGINWRGSAIRVIQSPDCALLTGEEMLISVNGKEAQVTDKTDCTKDKNLTEHFNFPSLDVPSVGEGESFAGAHTENYECKLREHKEEAQHLASIPSCKKARATSGHPPIDPRCLSGPLSHLVIVIIAVNMTPQPMQPILLFQLPPNIQTSWVCMFLEPSLQQ